MKGWAWKPHKASLETLTLLVVVRVTKTKITFCFNQSEHKNKYGTH